jgi:hypothetical protein
MAPRKKVEKHFMDWDISDVRAKWQEWIRSHEHHLRILNPHLDDSDWDLLRSKVIVFPENKPIFHNFVPTKVGDISWRAQVRLAGSTKKIYLAQFSAITWYMSDDPQQYVFPLLPKSPVYSSLSFSMAMI